MCTPRTGMVTPGAGRIRPSTAKPQTIITGVAIIEILEIDFLCILRPPFRSGPTIRFSRAGFNGRCVPSLFPIRSPVNISESGEYRQISRPIGHRKGEVLYYDPRNESLFAPPDPFRALRG